MLKRHKSETLIDGAQLYNPAVARGGDQMWTE